MKHLLTLTALLLTFSGLAQQMPYNPDANGDDFVGVDDVLGVLGVYDTALMQPDLQCDYEGTDLEQFMGNLFAGDIELDSIYVEYLLIDSTEQWVPGCPEPVVIETILERSYLLTNLTGIINGTPYYQFALNGSLFGHLRWVYFQYQNGTFHLYLKDEEVGSLT